MLSSLLLLALLILPSAPETVEQKIDLVAEGVAALLFLPSALETVKQKIDSVAEEVAQTLEGSRHIARSVVDTNRDLEQLEAKTVSVRAQLETLLLADFTLQCTAGSTEIRELFAIVGATQNATSQLLTELDTLRGRQAVAAAVQVSQVLMFVVYLLTVLSIYVVKRCQKVREKSQKREFELLEKKLLSNKAKRRAAAAKEKSAPAPSKE